MRWARFAGDIVAAFLIGAAFMASAVALVFLGVLALIALFI
jgi:hypothetical protein